MVSYLTNIPVQISSRVPLNLKNCKFKEKKENFLNSGLVGDRALCAQGQ